MDKYEKVEVVGEGSYGIVIKCKHRETGQMVAIKKFLETEEDLVVRKMALREIRMLKKLRHDNLVTMIEVFRRNRRFYLVFEFMDHTILDELEENTSGLGDETTRQHIYQVIRGIDYCHTNKVVHRDVKPENVLVSRLGVIKLCDFGFARLLASQGETYTDYVATRWYRAPELLVGDTKYGREVDIWAIGCLFSEMLTGDPLFPGDSDIDQLFQITKLLGKLSSRQQQVLTRNPLYKGTTMKKCNEEGTMRSLGKTFPMWPYLALDFISVCLKIDPNQRSTSRELLHHPYFIHDNFVERFIPELRSKVQQEVQGNPLLRRYSQSNLILTSAARRSRERLAEGDGIKTTTSLQRRGSFMDPPRWKVNLANENQNLENRRISLDKAKPIPPVPRRRLSDNCSVSNKMDVTEENMSNNSIRTDVFRSVTNGVFSKPSPSVDVSPPSPSPPPFHSLQTSTYEQQPPSSHNMQVLHPSINNLSFGAREVIHNTATNFNTPNSFLGKVMEPLKRSPQPLASRLKDKAVPMNPSMVPHTNLIRRLDRGLFFEDKAHPMLDHNDAPNGDKWHNNRRLGAIKANENAAWRANKDEFCLPNVPGASGSPSKVPKKKLNALNHHGANVDIFTPHSNNTSRSPSQSPKTRFSSKNFPFV